MKKNTTDSSPLQAPSFEDLQTAFDPKKDRYVTLEERMYLLLQKQIDLINKRLDILDSVVLNIPQEDK